MSIYAKDVTHLKTLDPYRLQELYQMHPCAEHVVKKMLVAGERSGGKDLDTDIADCIWTLQRWQAMREEDRLYSASRISPGLDATHSGSEEREIVSRYNWKEAPSWANYAATDPGGIAYWYASLPRVVHKQWADGIVHQKIGWVRAGSNWMESLEARPQ